MMLSNSGFVWVRRVFSRKHFLMHINLSGKHFLNYGENRIKNHCICNLKELSGYINTQKLI